jgi:hypothetical protein
MTITERANVLDTNKDPRWNPERISRFLEDITSRRRPWADYEHYMPPIRDYQCRAKIAISVHRAKPRTLRLRHRLYRFFDVFGFEDREGFDRAVSELAEEGVLGIVKTRGDVGIIAVPGFRLNRMIMEEDSAENDYIRYRLHARRGTEPLYESSTIRTNCVGFLKFDLLRALPHLGEVRMDPRAPIIEFVRDWLWHSPSLYLDLLHQLVAEGHILPAVRGDDLVGVVAEETRRSVRGTIQLVDAPPGEPMRFTPNGLMIPAEDWSRVEVAA